VAGPSLVFDLETQRLAAEVGGWKNVARMGLAVAVTLDLSTGEVGRYQEADAARLADELLAASLVVGFNIRRFDLAVLQPYTPRRLADVHTLDIMLEIERTLGFRLGLDALARGTLGTTKSAEGTQAVQWFREGRLEELFDYCQQDVLVTRELYEYGQRHKHLKYYDRFGRLKVVAVRW
jgi:DEAD/DEAH box helicase domain-containing protein